MKSRANNARTTNWDFQHGADEYVLGGVASLWEDGKIGVGPKIHRYRDRATRALCVLGLGITAVPLIIIALSYSEIGLELSFGGQVAFALLALLPGVLTLCSYLAFRSSDLRCEATGLRHQSIWGERFLPWSDIEKLEFGFCYVVRGQGDAAIRFSPFIADATGLKAEIKSRTGLTWREND
ncbi:hypothetical protein EON80_10455 [bacterium]|nr:MAG: hypothetical protein EON80_10455 [bacterium]